VQSALWGGPLPFAPFWLAVVLGHHLSDSQKPEPIKPCLCKTATSASNSRSETARDSDGGEARVAA
jgi:hypothetical protein